MVESVCLCCSQSCFYFANIPFRQIFPNQNKTHPVSKNSALAKIKEKRAERQALEGWSQNYSHWYVQNSINTCHWIAWTKSSQSDKTTGHWHSNQVILLQLATPWPLLFTQQHLYGKFSYQHSTWPTHLATLLWWIFVPMFNLAHSHSNIIMADFCNKAQLGPLTQQYLYDGLGQFQPIQLTGRLCQITPMTVKHGAPIPTLHTLQNPPRQPTQILLSTNSGQSSYSLCHEYSWQSGLKWSELHHSGLLCDSCPPYLPRTSISQPYLRKIYIIFIVSNIIIYKTLSAWPDFPDAHTGKPTLSHKDSHKSQGPTTLIPSCLWPTSTPSAQSSPLPLAMTWNSIR